MTLQVLPLKVVRALELDHASSRRCFSAASGMWVENDRLDVALLRRFFGQTPSVDCTL